MYPLLSVFLLILAVAACAYLAWSYFRVNDNNNCPREINEMIEGDPGYISPMDMPPSLPFITSSDISSIKIDAKKIGNTIKIDKDQAILVCKELAQELAFQVNGKLYGFKMEVYNSANELVVQLERDQNDVIVNGRRYYGVVQTDKDKKNILGVTIANNLLSLYGVLSYPVQNLLVSRIVLINDSKIKDVMITTFVSSPQTSYVPFNSPFHV